MRARVDREWNDVDVESVGVIGLDHVQLAAPPGSEEAARDFFGGVLGLPEIEKPAPLVGRGGVWLACGEEQIHVGIDPAFVPAAKAHPAFRLSSRKALEELATRLDEHGYDMRWDETLPGFARFYTTDPWGNRLEFLTPE